ncbi:ATP synthase subunit e, mitochondrial-like [Stegodyphus dumicola]|uniref:ATP synthase subunit e, mitochondrial-like n=1 Tax=Stegodyphus dumicola TaxID=202533 RepID=UPI0015A77005|nr:ATP synthase subunit e, mitochondrial-like [Stegodyphus dumicola]
MASAAELPPPVRVSPFIRACRYGALGTGFIYGVLRYKYLRRKENKIREYEQKQKAILDAKKAEEAKAKSRDEMIYLAKECGVPVPAGF